MAKAKKPTTTDAVEILHRRYFAGKPEMLRLLEENVAMLPLHGRSTSCAQLRGCRSAPLPNWLGQRHRSSADWRMPTMKVIPWQCSDGSPPAWAVGWKCASFLVSKKVKGKKETSGLCNRVKLVSKQAAPLCQIAPDYLVYQPRCPCNHSPFTSTLT